MTTYVALLRAVNLGAHNKVAMADLRSWMTAMGMKNPRTLLQSGNAVFESGVSAARLEGLLEDGARTALGLDTAFMLRNKQEWGQMMAANPFPKEADTDPGHLVLMCLKEAPAKAAVADLQAGIKGREMVRAVGRELYVVYPEGIGVSRLTTAVIERTLGTRATGRNWNTVIKVARFF